MQNIISKYLWCFRRLGTRAIVCYWRLWMYKMIIFYETYLYNIGWPWGGYNDILPEMLTILPESKTMAILLASRAMYSCIPLKAIQYYYNYYSYRTLCVILLSYDCEWLPTAILSVHKQGTIQVTYYCRAIITLLPSLSQRPGNNNIISLLVIKRVEYTISFWPPKALYG